ncbi:hypothetical protein [Phenylobacterium sp.]|uniref:hypothetical protein n=1 Tax=Phenylobacterium sp. TaxID=1871053 RepID=UPI0035B2A64B
MRISLILAAGAMALTAASAATAAGPGLGTAGQPSPGLGTSGRSSPGLGAPLAPRAQPADSSNLPTRRPYYAPAAPIAKIPEPQPAAGFKPFKARSTYDEPGRSSNSPGAPRPKGYSSTY